jgi:beta-lactamase regulating signal transducer with metallopeptidase domain
MLAHELAHVRRRDLFWLWFATFIQAVFFFNPLVWLGTREARLTQEIACDERAISCLQSPPSEYAMMLVDVASGTQPGCAIPLAVGVAESYRTIKRRVKAMKYIQSQSKRRLAFVSILTAVLRVGALVPWQLVAQKTPSRSPRLFPHPHAPRHRAFHRPRRRPLLIRMMK